MIIVRIATTLAVIAGVLAALSGVVRAENIAPLIIWDECDMSYVNGWMKCSMVLSDGSTTPYWMNAEGERRWSDPAKESN